MIVTVDFWWVLVAKHLNIKYIDCYNHLTFSILLFLNIVVNGLFLLSTVDHFWFEVDYSRNVGDMTLRTRLGWVTICYIFFFQKQFHSMAVGPLFHITKLVQLLGCPLFLDGSYGHATMSDRPQNTKLQPQHFFRWFWKGSPRSTRQRLRVESAEVSYFSSDGFRGHLQTAFFDINSGPKELSMSFILPPVELVVKANHVLPKRPLYYCLVDWDSQRI